MSRTALFLTFWVVMSGVLRADTVEALPGVSRVDRQPLLAQVQRLGEAMRHLGTPFQGDVERELSDAAGSVEFKWHVLRSASDHECVPEDFDHRAVRNLRSAALRPHGLLYTRQSLQLRKERVRHRAPAILAPSMDHEDNEVAVRK